MHPWKPSVRLQTGMSRCTWSVLRSVCRPNKQPQPALATLKGDAYLPQDLGLATHIHAADAEHGVQLRPALCLQGSTVAVDDIVGLPSQLPGGAHDQANGALICTSRTLRQESDPRTVSLLPQIMSAASRQGQASLALHVCLSPARRTVLPDMQLVFRPIAVEDRAAHSAARLHGRRHAAGTGMLLPSAMTPCQGTQTPTWCPAAWEWHNRAEHLMA